MADLAKRVVGEWLGSALMLAVVVGSATAAAQMAPGQPALALLVNSVCTGLGLAVLITAFWTVSGAHFNPAVSVLEWRLGRLSRRDLVAYVLAQVAGCFTGVGLAQAMFGVPVWEISAHVRSGSGVWLAEVVAMLGLLCVIYGTLAHRAQALPALVGAYITAGYWFTASGSFANPAATVARVFAGPVSGIEPWSALGYLLAELLGMALALPLVMWWWSPRTASA
jgi:glycerol uptake facilitator-like aquaporin